MTGRKVKDLFIGVTILLAFYIVASIVATAAFADKFGEWKWGTLGWPWIWIAATAAFFTVAFMLRRERLAAAEPTPASTPLEDAFAAVDAVLLPDDRTGATTAYGRLRDLPDDDLLKIISYEARSVAYSLNPHDDDGSEWSARELTRKGRLVEAAMLRAFIRATQKDEQP